jgi:hypothetical protein
LLNLKIIFLDVSIEFIIRTQYWSILQRLIKFYLPLIFQSFFIIIIWFWKFFEIIHLFKYAIFDFKIILHWHLIFTLVLLIILIIFWFLLFEIIFWKIIRIASILHLSLRSRQPNSFLFHQSSNWNSDSYFYFELVHFHVS